MKELKYLFKFYKKYRWRFATGIFFVVTSNIFALYPAIYTRKAFDAAKEAIESSHGSYDFINLTSILLYFGIMLILFALLKGLFMFFMRQTIIVMSRLIEFDLKNESLFVFVMYNMFSINVKLSLFVLAPLPIMSITIFFISKVIHTKSEKVQTQLSALSTLTQESFSGIRVLKSFVNEGANFSIFKSETNEYLKRNLSLAKTNAAFFPFMLLLIGLSTLLTIYIGGKESIAGNISNGNIAEFIIYVNMLTWPMASIGWVTSIIQRASASQKRINEFLNTKPEINIEEGKIHNPHYFEYMRTKKNIIQIKNMKLHGLIWDGELEEIY